jgi:thiol-disulfide isomerase/thioredoxin
MGGLSALGVFRVAAIGTFTLCLFAAAACDQNQEKAALAPSERSQVIEQKTTIAPLPTPTSTLQPAASSPPKPRRALCGGQLDAEGKAAPKRAISRLAAPGEPELAESPTFNGGFTWVNFWAAWCVPCKEEIPRLMGWQKKLSSSGKSFRVHFISVDDDERQLEKFLREQPAGALRSTYWLKEGKERDDWLSSAGVSSDPELPVHLLVDARGKIRCRVQGAVEDADYADLVSLLGG